MLYSNDKCGLGLAFPLHLQYVGGGKWAFVKQVAIALGKVILRICIQLFLITFCS